MAPQEAPGRCPAWLVQAPCLPGRCWYRALLPATAGCEQPLFIAPHVCAEARLHVQLSAGAVSKLAPYFGNYSAPFFLAMAWWPAVTATSSSGAAATAA